MLVELTFLNSPFLFSFTHMHQKKKVVPYNVTKYFVMREGEKTLHIIPLVTKYFVMRECENILSGYLGVLTTVFSQMMV